jgi:hypothetical protein
MIVPRQDDGVLLSKLELCSPKTSANAEYAIAVNEWIKTIQASSSLRFLICHNFSALSRVLSCGRSL